MKEIIISCDKCYNETSTIVFEGLDEIPYTANEILTKFGIPEEDDKTFCDVNCFLNYVLEKLDEKWRKTAKKFTEQSKKNLFKRKKK